LALILGTLGATLLSRGRRFAELTYQLIPLLRRELFKQFFCSLAQFCALILQRPCVGVAAGGLAKLLSKLL